MTTLNEVLRDIARATDTPRFSETWCSQCGKALGPGDHGESHCKDHVDIEHSMG